MQATMLLAIATRLGRAKAQRPADDPHEYLAHVIEHGEDAPTRYRVISVGDDYVELEHLHSGAFFLDRKAIKQFQPVNF